MSPKPIVTTPPTTTTVPNAALAAVVNRCLMKDPAQRYQSARDILTDLRVSLGQSATRTQG